MWGHKSSEGFALACATWQGHRLMAPAVGRFQLPFTGWKSHNPGRWMQNFMEIGIGANPLKFIAALDSHYFLSRSGAVSSVGGSCFVAGARR